MPPGPSLFVLMSTPQVQLSGACTPRKESECLSTSVQQASDTTQTENHSYEGWVSGEFGMYRPGWWYPTVKSFPRKMVTRQPLPNVAADFPLSFNVLEGADWPSQLGLRCSEASCRSCG